MPMPTSSRAWPRYVCAARTANQIGDTAIPVMKSAAPPVTADVDLFPGLRKSTDSLSNRMKPSIAP